jgi:hypothetical protein
MAKRIPGEPIQPDWPSNMIEVAVTLERPASEELAHYNRAEKYKILRENTAKHREKLVAWVTEQGLSEGVAQIGEPTTFNMLSVVCTPDVAEQLTQAPGVVGVARSRGFQVDLPRPTDKSPHL